jgi:hypothetical protein
VTGAYIGITLNEEIWSEAETRLNKSFVFEGSHRKHEANEVGILGEIISELWLSLEGISFVDCRESTELDYLIENAISLDVKTKDRTVLPKKYYDNSVPLYNHSHQRPDYYLFVSLLRNTAIDPSSIRRFTYACLLGGIDILTLDRDGTHWRAGQIDKDNGTKFWTDCINVSMTQLILLKELQMLWESEASKN